MDASPIKTDEDHRAALREIEALWGAQEGTLEGDRLNLLARLVEAFEERRWAASQDLIRLGGSDPDATAGRRRRAG